MWPWGTVSYLTESNTGKNGRCCFIDSRLGMDQRSQWEREEQKAGVRDGPGRKLHQPDHTLAP